MLAEKQPDPQSDPHALVESLEDDFHSYSPSRSSSDWPMDMSFRPGVSPMQAPARQLSDPQRDDPMLFGAVRQASLEVFRIRQRPGRIGRDIDM